MERMIFNLSADDRAALERVRIRLGLRSHAETLRTLIAEADVMSIQRLPDAPMAWPSGAVLLPEHTEDPGPTAPLQVISQAEAAKYKARPIVRRLKGEWKPK